MKRIALIVAVLLWGATTTIARPVDRMMAESAATRFAMAQFAMERGDMTPVLAYTEPQGAYYIFNFGNRGFVIIAADDAYRPVIGYSNESAFDVNNIPPALAAHLDGIAQHILALRAEGHAEADPMVAADWALVLDQGRLVSRNGGREGTYFCQTQWDQSYPYNYCCPEDAAGSGGHAIVGCLATAMSQLMRFWAYPTTGIGSHCYTHDDYGEICADFGNTTYDWANMPNKLPENAPEEEKIAVGTLCFHCGVTIDMGYGPDGSGGASGPIPGVMHTYFNYSDAIVQLSRNDFETEEWKTMVREQFDLGWPMYYGGCQDDGCHAFVCDGYDDFDMFHFNLGWGGGSDGWYLIDEAPYTHPADAMFNFVPAEVYNQTPKAPESLVVEPVSDTELKTHLSWTNPVALQDGTPLSSLDQVVVLRDNAIIRTLTGLEPGATVEIDDEDLPRFDRYQYAVYVVANGRHGRHATVRNVNVGPSCSWKVVMMSSDYQGLKGGYITVYNASGKEVVKCTSTSSGTIMEDCELPLGRLSFSWTAPETAIANIGIVIKDAAGNSVFNYSGPSEELPSGVFLQTNNGCGNEGSCGTPENLVATAQEDGILLTWDPLEHVGYGYNVYRDGLLFRLVPQGGSFLDDQAGLGGHCYRLIALCEDGESGDYSNESCASMGPCYPPRDLDYELTSNYKIKLLWERPSQDEGLTGYYIYRKPEGGEYQRIKMLGSSSNSYTDNAYLDEGSYFYRVCAFYKDLDCLSAPANRKYMTNVFELQAYYSPTGVTEVTDGVKVYPNPSDGQVTVEAEALERVALYNVLGQCVVDVPVSGDQITLDLHGLGSGLYVLHIESSSKVCAKKLKLTLP